jgi:hypothetical protein
LPAPPADERDLTVLAEETIPPMPLPPAPPIIAGGTVPAPAVTSELPEATAPSATVDRAVVASERDLVLSALHEYEAAFEGLDVVATAEVWPSVDRRALGRAFSTLKSQGLHFVDCSIIWNGSNATAQCDGTLEFVRRIGRPIPLTVQQRWVFRMRKIGTDWMIEDVTASSGESAARVR